MQVKVRLIDCHTSAIKLDISGSTAVHSFMTYLKLGWKVNVIHIFEEF